MAKLKPKQELFAFEYLKDLNATQAAIRAGYSKVRARRTGHDLLGNPAVQAIIEERSKKVLQQCEVDAAYVLAGAKEMFERCMQREQIVDRDGTPTGEYKFDSAGAGKALKIMGDHVAVNAFKGVDEDGAPIDQNWRVTIVGTDGKTKKVIGPDTD